MSISEGSWICFLPSIPMAIGHPLPLAISHLDVDLTPYCISPACQLIHLLRGYQSRARSVQVWSWSSLPWNPLMELRFLHHEPWPLSMAWKVLLCQKPFQSQFLLSPQVFSLIFPKSNDLGESKWMLFPTVTPIAQPVSHHFQFMKSSSPLSLPTELIILQIALYILSNPISHCLLLL